MPTHKSGLLFVNKTSRSKSLTNSRDDTEGLREIQQHAQRSRDYEKEKERRKRLRKSNLPLGWVPISSEPTRSLTLGHRRIAETPTIIKHEVVEKIRPLVGPCPKDEAKHGTPILSATTPTGATVEPFNQFRISMNTEKYRILEYFVRRYFPAVTRLDVPQFMGRPESRSPNPAILWVRNALTDEVHLLALLAAASARLKYVDRAHFAQLDLPEQLAEAALRNMRRYLAQGQTVSQELIQTILCLWAVESYKRNWNGVNTHRNMLLHLTDTYLGGFQNLEPYTRRMLWFADRFQAAATQTPPVIEDKWETEDLTPQQYKCVITAIREHGREPMAVGFIQASEIFSADFQELVRRIVKLCSVVQCRWIGVSVQPLIPDRDWAVGRGWAISDELIGFKDDPILLRSLRYRRLQDCVRLALIAWLAFVPAGANHSPDSRAISAPMVRAAIDAKPLRARLAGILGSHGKQCPPRCEKILLFWVAALGAVASELVENQEWFALHFQAFARQLEIYTWEEFMPITERFLLLEYLQPANCTKLTWLLQRAAYAEVGD
ncbi:hypothetical protein LTR10_018835 [Elasticomyces elasticus]|uniref:Uncharacterized protein n=1 Tax=Exophiala sideris TaxID=1016849 RepID=A0ABR0IVZ7_9EURO|nr:hypothetical protein LTR10_018835 [Elasticomyces elasticus]KAK5021634.1 hypothetical protein LTS07_010805 [Exophiala sideris]KAK5024862.1 hypothetical protein LTR13_010705 [Exophiala sideris]KAK5049772.1 hypothetical protein LTR69_010829 [Exophiala sideris]KAK5176752.1 hypothetical protein LTR44_010695 [Eurotiomycetes sp. CCFEE 6388]